MGQEEKICDEVETEFTYPGDRLSAGKECEAAVTVRTRCGKARLRVWRVAVWLEISSKLKEAVYKSHVRPAILHGGETLCLRESKMEILRRMERSMMRAM